MKIIIYVSLEDEDIWYTILEDGDVEPVFIKPKKPLNEGEGVEGDDEVTH